MKTIIIGLLIATSAIAQDLGPHATRVQDATAQQSFVQDMLIAQRELGNEVFIQELWKFLIGSPTIISGTATVDPGQVRYDAGLNPATNSLVNRIYKRVAVTALIARRTPDRVYMSNVLVRDSTSDYSAAISRKIQRRIAELSTDLGVE